VSLISRYIKANTIRSVTGLGAIFSNDDLKFRFIRHIVLNVLKFKGAGQSKHSYVFENNDDLMLFQRSSFAKSFKLVHIAGAGVDIKKYSYTPLPSKPFTILFAARLIKSKGLEQLVEAVSILRDQGYRLILNVAGICDDDVRGAIPIQLINKWHSEGVINWLGNISNMPQQISLSHIVCLPSRYGEGVPRVLLEGASCGRALITNNISGCRDIVVDGKTGILTQVGNVSSLVNAISTLYLDPIMCDRFGKNGRELVKQKFEQGLVISSFLSLYCQ
jgi:glycosyltransferase involved in cell wall biosynthesis